MVPRLPERTTGGAPATGGVAPAILCYDARRDGTSTGRVLRRHGSAPRAGPPDDAPAARDRLGGDADAGPHLSRTGREDDPGGDARRERLDDLPDAEPPRGGGGPAALARRVRRGVPQGG